jgi:glyoxylase-like metal-dependent hydrolase (beta-lactamase superfamily II)
VAGVEIGTDLGPFVAYETPGHAPSHVCLFLAERRLLISGDHLLGRVSLYYDYGWTPDPVGEFLGSLDVVEALDARLCVAGHGRPFTDLSAHIAANRKLVDERVAAVAAALEGEPRTVAEIVPAVYGEPLTERTASWWISETLCYLRHLEVEGAVRRESEAEAPDRWRRA